MKYKMLSVAGPKGENQDVILPPFEAGDCTWCAIADGVGSSTFGGLAARSCIEVVHQVNSRQPMIEVFANAGRKLLKLSTELGTEKSISTTLSVLRICQSHALVGHVGDTRISHYRGSGVMARTKDQTEVQKLLDDGVLTKNQAARYPRRNVLLSALSAGREYSLSEQEFEIQTGDRILLTSDGFHSKVLRGEIAEISAKNQVFEDFWRVIEHLLSGLKLEDDASCLAIEIN